MPVTVYSVQNKILYLIFPYYNRTNCPVAFITGATRFVYNQPCSLCAKLMMNRDLAHIIYEGDYHNKVPQ